MNINKVSQSIASQSPEFLKTEYPLFNKFIEYYYRSQEKTGLGQNIVNNFLQYLDIDKLDINILDGATKVVEPITDTSDTIVVESVDNFLDTNGSILIGDEVIYYEKTTASPSISLSPGISYDQVKLKWTGLAQIIDLFDGTRVRFPLTSQSSPISAPSAQHLIVKVYGETLSPVVDYTVDGTDIVFTTAPRTRIAADDNVDTEIIFLSGFIENSIVSIDDISGSFGEGKTEFKVTVNGGVYEPIADEYILAVYDNRLLVPKQDFYLDGDIFIFDEAPLNGRAFSLYSIEAPIPDFGSGAVGYARVSDSGELDSISISQTGSGYDYKYPPKVSINSANGSGGAATALVNGVKNSILLDGGRGYSDTNPPLVIVEEPTNVDAEPAKLKATVTNGSVSSIEIVSSGSGYTFVPRVTFKQPGGAKLGSVTIVDGSVSGTIEVTNGGSGYTTAPQVYIDAPTGDNPVIAKLQAVLTDGVVTSINIVNSGQGYTSTPRVAIIDPTGAQVLQTLVDGSGRVVSVELLDGGIGYEDVPSVYIVDDREDGGTGATATANVFNGKITDINITNFGTGYSVENPPTVIIQSPPQAKSSVEIGLNEVTGFTVSKSGSGYNKARFEGCARAASGIVKYTESGNAVFSNNTTSAAAAVDTEVKCLDSLFVKRLLDKYTEQFLPDVPELDYTKIDVRNAIKSVKDFYSTKGTSFSIAYLFKLLYGEEVTVSYPKDQIIKPSNATWSIDTILRATLVSGDPTNIKDGLLVQEPSIADPNIGEASALIENYIAIRTSDTEIYELVLSEETIQGTFVVPYKTKLAEPLNTTDSIITVDSTIGWPERNGEFVIGGTELIQYKEKSLNQFIECTRSVNGVVEDWDSATEVVSNLTVYVNRGTPQEVVLNIVGIVDAQQTSLTDTGSYYLAGDKLTVSKLGGTSTDPELTTWLYNVKKLLEVESITFGGVNNRFATVTCENNHGLLVGDQVTVYGANPIIYNGTFLVTSRDSSTVFQYQLPQAAEIAPQGNILVSVDLNKGKSDNSAVLNSIGPYTTNIQNSFFNNEYVYVASTGIPNYKIGPFPGSALLPGNQRKLNRFPLSPSTISIKDTINPGPIGTWINGTSVWSYKSNITKTFGPITKVNILNAGSNYDASSPPNITISGGGGSGATGTVTVNGSITEISVDNGGSGYTTPPLISIVGGGGSGAAATAIITKGVVSSILVNTGGSGYTSAPTITVVGGGGSGATATASVRGPIQSIAVTNGGESYTSKPDVVLSSGTGAVAQAIVSNGRIISIAIISAGQGYTTAPEVDIQGDGFGAIAKATIDIDGENAGRVTNIEIINRGINYTQGTTLINLTSVGSGAQFEPEVFQWTYNLEENTVVDSARGSVFAGFNTQYGGEYAHISNPQRLRYILGDNLYENITGSILEQEDQLEHSPIIGWAFDGNPIYGPYGYSDPTNQGSSIARLNTSYRLKTNLVYDEITNPTPVREQGPLLSDEAAGNFIEDYEYSFGLGDLDQYNGRFCKTPDFPTGRYCYFITIDATDAGNPQFPYVLGPSYNSVVDKWNLAEDAIQQNIPTGVVRYRDPYENVDIDVERAPNASTNALTLENGDILLFEVEDENRDGIISQDEQDDPDQIFEESPLQLFDYFPTVKLDSKVDIEVETITKFENASVDGFIIEDPGTSYQVDDILTFDNSDTDGIGVSARVSRIKGLDVNAYTFENDGQSFTGKLTTSSPHDIIPGDVVYVDYTPVMDETNKQFVVRQYKGIEEVIIEQLGTGYDTEIPPTIIIDGDGVSASLTADVNPAGTIDTVNIINAGSGYTESPRVILSHPQIFKKASYYVSLIENENYVKVNDVFVNDDKDVFFCGKTLDDLGNTVAFISKFSELGVKEWEKTLESEDGETYAEFVKLDVNGNVIWVVGENKPNSALLTAYNPDIILAKYTQSLDGLSATLDFQKGYAGISGSTRSDKITTVKRYSDTRYIIGGFTNTNSANPQDAFIASIDSLGSFAAKRKIASASGSEKVTDLVVLNDAVYFVMETAPSDGSSDTRVSFGKALVGTSVITIEWIKEITNSAYSFGDTSLVVDEFNEFYITSTLSLKTDTTTKDSFWVGKLDTDGDLLWNYRYIAPTGNSIRLATRSTIDIFGDLNLAYTRTDSSNGYKTVDTVKISYDGKIKTHTNTAFNANNIEGITVNAISVDNSGDVYAFGQTSWNRNEIICEFASDATDKTGHYTLETLSAIGSDSVKYEGGYAKIFGKDATAGRLLTIDTIGAADASRTEGSYTITATDYTTDASGTGATFTVDVDGSGAATVTVVNPGSGFVVDETFTIADAQLGGGGAAALTFDAATVSAVDDWVNGAIKVAGNSLGSKLDDDWTIEFMIHKDADETNDHSQTQQTLFAIGDATLSTGGIWLYYDISSGRLEFIIANNSTTINAGTAIQSTQTNMFADDSWQFIGVKKDGNVFTVYVNGIQVLNGTMPNTSFLNKDVYFGNIPGKSGSLGEFRSNEQGQFYLDNLVIKNRAITPTVPSDVTSLPPTQTFALGFTWVDTTWFTDQTNQYDYIDYVGFGIKCDKDSETDGLGDQGVQTNTEVGFERTAITPVTGIALVVSNVGYALGGDGLQALDYEDSTVTMQQDTLTLSYTSDDWNSRTATVPSPGSRKLKISTVVKNRFYMKQASTTKIDNVQELTINQDFNVTIGSKLVLNSDSGSFINSGYVLRVDNDNDKIYVAVNNNLWSNDLTTGLLSTTKFDEQSTYGIVGPNVNDVNEISEYYFNNIVNTTPGTFDIDLNDYNLNRTDAPGSGNLDSFAKFKPFDIEDYSVRIEEIGGSSSFIPGSVVNITSSDISFNADKTTAQITNLTGVTKITLIATLDKVLQVTAVANTDEVYVITGSRHYLSVGDNIYVDGNPDRTVGSVVYDEYNGSFVVDTVVSNREFTYKLSEVAQTDPADTAANVSIFAKSPVLKMYYGHQYLFDMSHSTLLGSNLSFSKDNLYKLEYSFNSIERIGTPGVTGEGQTNPTVKLKVDRDIVTNISYYFDPSRLGADSPIDPSSYLDIVDSPYVGNFTVTSVDGATITTGANIMKFALINEPEGSANISKTTYTTSSKKAVGPIGDIRLINTGGFYARLPVVTGIQSSRKIERVQINEPGTEYAVGVYTNVPISGDGEGGLVSITVADGTNDEGDTIPGQIQEVTVTSPGKGYTTAFIDVESVSGILGAGLSGSGADIEVIIPAFGTGAVVFTKGTNVGKIKKLKNNNFGYDYTHDYTLRPEITFPINAQLTSTNILDSIAVTDPGSGYSQAPTVVITGGGGSGAIAEASIRNGRIDQIVIKDPGSGYSSAPTVSLRSSFNYVVNLDLGLLQFAFPHGIANGAEVTLNVVDTGDGAEFPLASGAIGRLNGSTTYYAIAGSSNSLESDQLKLAITQANAELGDAIAFANAGTGRQQVLTESFGAAATAKVVTSTFLEGELVYQGDSLENATATGYVSTNQGWQVGPRILKIVDYSGNFANGESITGTISKSSGIISDLKIAKGVLEIGPITKTTGQFIDDVGKPSEIIQKIQDSYYYQDFSYAVKSSVSIDDWKDILVKNVHPASFKVFGELSLEEYGYTANKEIDFELTKSVELAREATVPNIQSFALAEPIYSEFNNTEVLFRQKKLTSSENILTSVVQRLDNISDLFDGVRTQFPLTVNNENVIANANQLLIVLNGVAQTPNTSFEVQGDSIVFAEPPSPPASVKYVNIGIEQINTKTLTFPENTSSGIFPSIGDTLVGIVSAARLTVTSVSGQSITGFVTEGTFIGPSNGNNGESCSVSATGFNGQIGQIDDVVNRGLFAFNETVTNLDGDTAVVETINLETGQETPIAKIRYSIGAATTSIEVISTTSATDAPVPTGTFTVTDKYQIGSEIVTVNSVSNGSESTTLTVSRGIDGTTAVSHQEDTPMYSTEIEITNALTLSRTTGTYQSKPGLYNIVLDDVIIGASSGVVARVTSTSAYQDPVTEEFIEQVNISSGSSFFGLLFNRLTSVTYPNVIIDDISKSQVSIVDFDDNSTAFDSKFPANESISNNIMVYDNESGDFTDEEFIRNYKIRYGSNTGEFIVGENCKVKKLTFTDQTGSGFFSEGQIIRSRDTKAEIIGYSQARKTIYLGKVGRTKNTGEDYHTITFNGDAQLDTAQKKFGAASLLLDGTGDYLSIATSTEFGFGTGDFTIETWIRPDNVSAGDRHIFDMRDTGSDANAGRLYIATNQLRFNIGGSDVVTSGATTFDVDTWYHIAVSRSGTDLKMFVDGSEVDSTTNSTDLGSTKRLFIGSNLLGVNAFSGHIDDFRVSTNARYTAAFTAPTGMFHGDANTVLLIHFDGADAQTYTQDWSGSESFTDGEEFHNDAILETWRAGSANLPAGFNYKTHRYYNAAESILKNVDLLSAEGNHAAVQASPFQFDPLAVPTEINATTPVTNTYYGRAVAISTDTATQKVVVGAYGDNTYQGRAYIYDLDGTNEIVVSASDATNYDRFGWSVATNGNKVVVGAPYDDDGGSASGSIYIYDKDGTNQVKVVASDDAASNYYGECVVMTDTYIFVGARGNNNFRGAVYRYDLDGTNELKITASDAGSSDQFGRHLAVGSNKLVVGAPYDDDGAINEGAAYVYNLDGTGEVKIVCGDSSVQSNTNFGYIVAVGNNKIAVGAQAWDGDPVNSNVNAGAVFVYDLDGTNELRVTPSDAGSGDSFGAALAIGENKLFVGAYNWDNGNLFNTGAVYVFDLDGTNQQLLNLPSAQYDYYTRDGALAVGNRGIVAGAQYADPNNTSSAGKALIWSFTQELTSTNFTGTYSTILNNLVEDVRNGSNSHIWDTSASLVDRSGATVSGIVGYSTVDDDQLLTGLQTIQGHMSSIVNNVPITIAGTHTFTQWTDSTVIDSSYGTLTTLTPTTATYDPATGDFVITVAGHGLTTSNIISLAPESFRFTCTSDGNDCVLAHPRVTDTTAYNRVLKISATTTDTFTVNVGVSPSNAQFAHTFVSVDADAVTVLDYTTGDCADVVSTVANLLDIAEDTISEAVGFTSNTADGDHLATITKVTPATEFIGGAVDAFYEVPFTVKYHNGTTDVVYTHRLDAESRNRFADAANLLRANTAVIVDKAAYDLLQRYPDLANEMPRNGFGDGAGTTRCKTDLTLILGELAKDIQYGGNENTITAARFYLNTNNELQHIRLQVWQSVYAHERLGYYMKQAINGDLTYDNTDNIITGDWGITNDPGGCQNVQDAIDTLIDTFNDIIAPTSNDYNIAADRLYFNRKYIAEEIVGRGTLKGLLGTELFYQLTNGDYNAIAYDRDDYTTYITDFIIAMISDLQTGGDNSTITQMQRFLSTTLKISDDINTELYAFFYTHEQIKFLAEKAIKNLLYTAGQVATGDQYAAQFTDDTAYRDSETPTDIDAVSCRMNQLVDIGLDTIMPGDIEARSAIKNILYNENYYKAEIASTINSQFGADSWEYDSFVEDIVDNIQYDLFTTDTKSSQTAYTLTFSSYSGTFTEGTTVTNGSSTSTVLYSSGNTLIVGAITGTVYSAGDTITASGATGIIAEDGITTSHQWYDDISNIKAIETAASISSLIEGAITTANLWTLPEQFEINWTESQTEVSANSGNSPDGTSTADKVAVTETTAAHYIQRSYTLTSFTTLDATNVRFDSGTTTFDAGANTSTQTFTASMFVKASEYNNIQFQCLLDSGSQYARFKVNLNTGVLGSLFQEKDNRILSTSDNGTADSNRVQGVYPVNSVDGSVNGIGASFSVSVASDGTPTVTRTANGINFEVNETITIAGSDIGGGADLVITVTSVDSPAMKVLDYGAIPFGNGWFRVYITSEFGFGFATLNTRLNVLENITQNDVFLGVSADTKILPSSSRITSYSDFGAYNSVRVGNGKIVVGARRDNTNGYFNQGSVFVYNSDGTNEIELTSTSANRSYKYFGHAVDVGSDKIVVGAYGEYVNNQPYSGAAYIFDLDGSNPIRIDITDAGITAASYQYFGYAVAIGGDEVFVGAYRYSAPGQTYRGAVFVFDLNGNYQRTLIASNGLNYDYFGVSLATGDGKLAVGATGVGTGGGIYVYNLDGTGEVAIIPSGAQNSDNIGRYVAIGEGKVVTSGEFADGYGTNAGTAWVFNLDGTGQVELGSGLSLANYDYFGSSLAIGGGKIAIGARGDDSYRGRVYLFDLDGTNPTSFTAYDRGTSDYFGYGVALSGGKLYSAAPFEDAVSGGNKGSLYVIDITGGPGVFAWGAKLSNQPLGTYVAVSGDEFYANAEFNIKQYTVNLLEDFIGKALDNSLTSPSPAAGFQRFYDSTIAANYNANTIKAFVTSNIDIIRQQLKSSLYYTTVTENNGLTVATKNYGERDIPIGISGELIGSDYFYSDDRDIFAEIQSITLNEAKIAKSYVRFRIPGDITDGPFTMNENVQKQGDAAVTGVVYGFFEDDNYKYLDVAVTAGTWDILDTVVGLDSGASAQIDNLENRLQLINVLGSFEEDISFLGYTSTQTAQPVSYTTNQAAVTDNTGGKLTVDTETLQGSLETTSVVFPESSREYLEVSRYAGFDPEVGEKIASIGHVVLTVNVDSTFNQFTVGNKVFLAPSGAKDQSVYGIITELDLSNNLIYVVQVQGTFGINNQIGDFGLSEIALQGSAQITNKVTVAGAASARIQDIRDAGLNKRLYLTDIAGTFSGRDGIRATDSYRAAVLTKEVLKARVKRFFKGFDGTQTTFDLTINNGTQYLPDPAGHMLIFVNGVLQPPGSGNAYNAFSDKIQFTEPPDLGASFTGFYVGKLRQLDDISFEFDSLRQSFNLRRDDIFYSLTLTDGVQSSVIRPENNILVSVNGVLQEPGVGFEIVGSRIIFSEIPRVGSTFVAFSYVGSEADVDADVVVPPVEPGDFIEIEGEVGDREVAVIESSNSLITFDYLGSVFGQDADANANLTSGYIEKVQVTSGGSGYTSRPAVRLDSISGFDGQVKALVGVAGVTLSNVGSGYENPGVDVETSVPDDWTPPNLADYGEEVIDPEVIS